MITTDIETKVKESMPNVLETAWGLVVEDEKGAGIAHQYARTIKDMKNEILEYFDPIKGSAHDTWKRIVAKEKDLVTPLENAEKTVKGKIAAYLDKVEAEKKAIFEKAAEVARKERARILAKVEKRMEDLSAKQLGIQEQIDALENDLTLPPEGLSETEAEIIRNKIMLLEAKLENTSAAIQDQQVKIEETFVPEPIPAPQAPKMAGISSRMETVVEVRNAMALIRAVADGKIPTGVITFDVRALKKLAEGGMTIPGCQVSQKRIVGVR